MPKLLHPCSKTLAALPAMTALAAMSALLTLSSHATPIETFSDYVVSESGHYLFATVDSHQDPPVHRVFVIETANPEQKSAIGDDFQGKGFAGIYCSKDERWLCVNLGVGVHGAECYLFKHVDERRFDELNTADLNAKIKSTFESSARPGFTFDSVYGQYWKDDSLVLVANGRGQKDGNFYDDKMFLEYQPANGQIIALSRHFVWPMSALVRENVDSEYEKFEAAALKAYEESLQHQLKVIYGLLCKSLIPMPKPNWQQNSSNGSSNETKNRPGATKETRLSNNGLTR